MEASESLVVTLELHVREDIRDDDVLVLTRSAGRGVIDIGEWEWVRRLRSVLYKGEDVVVRGVNLFSISFTRIYVECTYYTKAACERVWGIICT